MVELDIVEAEVFCPFCKCWRPVRMIKFGPDYIAAECSECGTTIDYDIKGGK